MMSTFSEEKRSYAKTDDVAAVGDRSILFEGIGVIIKGDIQIISVLTVGAGIILAFGIREGYGFARLVKCQIKACRVVACKESGIIIVDPQRTRLTVAGASPGIPSFKRHGGGGGRGGACRAWILFPRVQNDN